MLANGRAPPPPVAAAEEPEPSGGAGAAATTWYERACARVLPDFALGGSLGKGAFAVVLSATHGPTGMRVALKVSDKASETLQNPKILHRVRAEARALRKLHGHPNIMRCFGAVEDDRAYALVLSFEAGRSLAESVSADGAMGEKPTAVVALQIARALRHCHARKIAHRDVKLDNIVYDKASGRATLCDFGLALVVKTMGGSRLDVRCGSPEYSAPELVDPASKGYYGPAVDMWAFGVAVYAMLCATFPFGQAQTKICRGTFDRAALDRVGGARDLIEATLVVDPNSDLKLNRLSAAGACKHPWLRLYEKAADAAVAGLQPDAPASGDALPPQPAQQTTATPLPKPLHGKDDAAAAALMAAVAAAQRDVNEREGRSGELDACVELEAEPEVALQADGEAKPEVVLRVDGEAAATAQLLALSVDDPW